MNFSSQLKLFYFHGLLAGCLWVLPAGAAPEAFFDLPEDQETGEPMEELSTNQTHITLSWRAADEVEGLRFQLQQLLETDDDEWVTVYEGADLASFRAGLPEGTHSFRIRAIDAEDQSGPWSPTLPVVVEYQPMRTAITLFIVGAVVFLSTCALVLGGAWRTRHETVEEQD